MPLAYADRAIREKLPPMIRIGGVIGFLGLCSTALMLPVWKYPDHCGQYKPVVSTLVPAVQLLCVGSGMTLIICGRIFSRRKPRAWYWFPVLMNVFVLAVAIGQIKSIVADAERPQVYVRWGGLVSL